MSSFYSQQSVQIMSARPLTQAVVGALEIALEEIAALQNYRSGPWVEVLEQRLLGAAAGLNVLGKDRDQMQVAQSALRECLKEMKARLT